MHHTHTHDRGLAFDLATLHSRRRVLTLFGGAGLVTLVGCRSEPGGTASAGSDAGGSTPDGGTGCVEIPDETAGPYPGDGSNGPNVLIESGIVRRDIRSSFGAASGTAEGMPLTITLTLVDVSDGCTPLPGTAVYLWHCDAEGNYSMYSPAAADQNYLRGVQAADDTGQLSFVSTFPGAYDGRWPHIHLEVYGDLAAATSAGEPLKTSQLALPQEVCEAVYATSGYRVSADNLARTELATDIAFRDGYQTQLATVTGDVGSGYTASLTVAV